MSVHDNNELISFDDIPASNNSNKSFDINSEKDSMHSFNGSDDKDTERTSFDDQLEQQGEHQETKTTETMVEQEKQVSTELSQDLKEDKEEQEEKEQEQEEQVSSEQNLENTLSDQDDDFGDFDDENNNDDDFGDFDDEFTGATDDFGDFNDEAEVAIEEYKQVEEENIPKTPTTAELYCDVLNDNNISNITSFIDDHLNDIMNPNNTILSLNTEPKQVLSTQCSQELWDRLSRDSVFFNPVTGTVGQFQWIRSETNKSYLNALGVTINYDDEKTKASSANSNNNSARTSQKKRHTTLPLDTSIASNNSKSPTTMSAPSTPDGTSSHSRSASATISDGLRVATQHREEDKEAKREADQEMELDIDIARAYCELTEETIRIFPDVKLNAMVVELKRLQRQAADYLDSLLDQREQLLMDAETYNDLISCIVGHAQRLREQNASKDASPAMVQKKKTGGKFGGLMRKKTANPSTQSVSMGGGVVGVKQQQQQQAVKKPLSVNESRRSL